MANIILLSLISFFTMVLHPLYISVTDIEHDNKSKILKITMRVFIDDLETSIRNDINKPSMDITLPGEGFSTDQLVEDYIRKHFRIDVNEKEVSYTYLGHELELPVIYMYLQVEGVKKLNTIKVFNDMIMESYEDQTNLVHVEVNGKTKSMKLTDNHKEDILRF